MRVDDGQIGVDYRFGHALLFAGWGGCSASRNRRFHFLCQAHEGALIEQPHGKVRPDCQEQQTARMIPPIRQRGASRKCTAASIAAHKSARSSAIAAKSSAPHCASPISVPSVEGSSIAAPIHSRGER